MRAFTVTYGMLSSAQGRSILQLKTKHLLLISTVQSCEEVDILIQMVSGAKHNAKPSNGPDWPHCRGFWDASDTTGLDQTYFKKAVLFPCRFRPACQWEYGLFMVLCLTSSHSCVLAKPANTRLIIILLLTTDCKHSYSTSSSSQSGYCTPTLPVTLFVKGQREW